MPIDFIKSANSKSLEQFLAEYLPASEKWNEWTHPHDHVVYHISLQKATSLTTIEFEECFKLVELTSKADYVKAPQGWKPKAKKKEMKLLDLKYLVVKLDNQVEAFVSFMPTYEDNYPVLYCYEIHLARKLQGSGLGRILMERLETIARRIPRTEKVMLTCFLSNERALTFYKKLGYSLDEFSPPAKVLRDGTKIVAAYEILSKKLV